MDVHIFFTTETGNAGEAAATLYSRLTREFEGLILPVVHNLDIYGDIYNFSRFLYLLNKDTYTLCIYIIPTYGHGDPPGALRDLWVSMLDESLDDDFLNFENIQCTAFGLGDRKYPSFCHMALKWVKRLQELGMKFDMSPLGLGDAQHEFGWEGEFDPWCDKLIENLKAQIAIKGSPITAFVDKDSFSAIMGPRYQVCDTVINGQMTKDRNNRHIKEKYKPKDALKWIVKENKKVTAEGHFQDVRHVSLLAETDVAWQPGDSIAVYPKIPTDMVTKFLEEAAVSNEDTVKLIDIKESKDLWKFPAIYNSISINGLCLKEIFTSVLDISAKPTRIVLNCLSNFAFGQHKRKLLELSSFTLEGMFLFDEYIRSEKRSFFDLFMDFGPYMKVPIPYLLTLIPPIMPRLYSVTSSFTYMSNRLDGYKAAHILGEGTPDYMKSISSKKTTLPVSILVAHKLTTSKDQRVIKGTCSSFVMDLSRGDVVFGKLIRAAYNWDWTSPIVIVCAGTGVAPVRNILYERFCRANGEGPPPLVYLGIRDKDSDPLYLDELNALNVDLNVIQSRVGPKEYVQDRIYRDPSSRRKVFDYLVNKNGVLVIAGNHQPMAVQVLSYIADLITEEDSSINGQEYLQNALALSRVIIDAW